MDAKDSIDLKVILAKLASFRMCIANRWKCEKGHEWVTAHGGVWLQMPTTCPECGRQAVAHKGEWETMAANGENQP